MWGAIAAVAKPVMDVLGQTEANKMNKKQADLNREFQEDMSNTSHQREVEDLRAAGLNPILSANAGASTPSGGTAEYKSTSPDFDPMIFANLKQAKATTENTVADTGLKSANTKSAEKSLEIADETKKLLQAQTAKEGELARQSRRNADLLDKYGEASQVMGLINSGTGSIGNLLGAGNWLKGLIPFSGHSGPPNKSSAKKGHP